MKLNVSKPILYLITKGDATDQDFEFHRNEICTTVRRAVEAEIAMVQIREKNLSARFLYELAREAAAITRGPSPLLLINDRIDIAVASGADGVHITSRSMPVRAVRGSAPQNFLVGVSTHSVPEIHAARREGADFVVYGPVFETPGKGEPKGIDDLAEACQSATGFPVLALGGVNAGNFDQVIAAGAAGAAAIRWMKQHPSMRKHATRQKPAL